LLKDLPAGLKRREPLGLPELLTLMQLRGCATFLAFLRAGRYKKLADIDTG
jgi:hypothetical protein